MLHAPATIQSRHFEGPGFILLDGTFAPVFANDVAMRVLTGGGETPGTSETGAGDQSLQRLGAWLQTAGSVASEFTYAGRLWRCMQFRWAAKGETLWALICGPEHANGEQAQIFARMFGLTNRESEALTLYLRGLSPKEVAARMSVSASTAKTFLRMITAKMRVSTRAEMMSKVMDHMCGASLTCAFCTTFPSESTNLSD